MIREIKFRGLRVDNNEWVDGSLLQSEIDVNQISVQCAIVTRFAHDYNLVTYPVKPETVSQYTGLKDKNGKEIYEWDIVKWDDGSKGKYWRVAIVFYDNDEAMFCFRIIKNTIHALSTEEGYVFAGNFVLRGKYQNPSKELIIIGNIFKNPELIK